MVSLLIVFVEYCRDALVQIYECLPVKCQDDYKKLINQAQFKIRLKRLNS